MASPFLAAARLRAAGFRSAERSFPASGRFRRRRDELIGFDARVAPVSLIAANFARSIPATARFPDPYDHGFRRVRRSAQHHAVDAADRKLCRGGRGGGASGRRRRVPGPLSAGRCWNGLLALAFRMDFCCRQRAAETPRRRRERRDEQPSSAQFLRQAELFVAINEKAPGPINTLIPDLPDMQAADLRSRGGGVFCRAVPRRRFAGAGAVAGAGRGRGAGGV